MTDPRDLEKGDELRVSCEALSGALWDVADVDVKDIGLTETYGVVLVSASESDDSTWLMVGTTADSLATLERPNGDGETHIINWNDITYR